MPARALLLVAGFAALAVTGCASARATRGRPATGIYGKVVREPVCPVALEGHMCETRPLAGARIVVLAPRSHRRMRSARTDRRGLFRIRLAPGAYVLAPQRHGALRPRRARIRVRVPADRYVAVAVRYAFPQRPVRPAP